MPCLVIFALPQLAADSSYDAFDVIEVLPRGQHPGTAVVDGPTRFGFLWIDNREAPFVKENLLEQHRGLTPEDGADAGDFPYLKRRRFRLRPENLPLDDSVYRQFRIFDNPASMHVDWADLLSTHRHDKRDD